MCASPAYDLSLAMPRMLFNLSSQIEQIIRKPIWDTHWEYSKHNASLTSCLFEIFK